MRFVLAFAIGMFLAILEASFMPYFQVLGVTPNLVLIFAASWAMVRGQDEAMVVIPMAGLLHDLTTSDPLGTSVLALAPILVLAAGVHLRAMDTDFVPTVLVVAVASLTYGIITMVVLSATGQRIPWFDGMVSAVVPSIVVNALFTPIVYLPIHWLGVRPTTRILGPGRITTAVTAKRS